MGARHYVEGNSLGVGLCQTKIEGTPPSLRVFPTLTPHVTVLVQWMPCHIASKGNVKPNLQLPVMYHGGLG